MAAAADYAISNHFPRLASTHALARRLADGLEALGCRIIAQVDTNMVSRLLPAVTQPPIDPSIQVFFDPVPIGLTIDSIMARLKSLPIPIQIMRERLVVHHQTSAQAVQEFVDAVREMKEEKMAGQHPEKEGERLREEERMIPEANLRKQAALGY